MTHIPEEVDRLAAGKISHGPHQDCHRPPPCRVRGIGFPS